eukprot:CAMPEP_0172155268 /NCGR_PEP_ID=MMETSP1050-20130122/2528_1 /TAXON_ID=233186 /ORGANISM="Cryptomonas curvata, Strain CCAP979/52" /LENGTH=131 /DNA_ID=CAMNT_0012824141 /DNA_START=53 /DNA_END=445 /DNA_ORIENTATION=-
MRGAGHPPIRRDGNKTTPLAQKPSKFATAWRPQHAHQSRPLVDLRRDVYTAPASNQWPSPLSENGLVDPMATSLQSSALWPRSPRLWPEYPTSPTRDRLRGDPSSADGGSPILPFPSAPSTGPHDSAGAGG